MDLDGWKSHRRNRNKAVLGGQGLVRLPSAPVRVVLGRQ